MKEMFFCFKFRGDVEIINVFKSDFFLIFLQVYFDKYFVFVFILFSKEWEEECGFNQVWFLVECLDWFIYYFFICLNNEKQFKKKKIECLFLVCIFDIKNNLVEGMNIILIDDFYIIGVILYFVVCCLLEKGRVVLVVFFILIRS